MISGASRSDEDTFHEDTRARLIFFLYAKLLHELAHASMAELGRNPGRMPTLVYDRILPNTAAVTVCCRIFT